MFSDDRNVKFNLTADTEVADFAAFVGTLLFVLAILNLNVCCSILEVCHSNLAKCLYVCVSYLILAVVLGPSRGCFTVKRTGQLFVVYSSLAEAVV